MFVFQLRKEFKSEVGYLLLRKEAGSGITFILPAFNLHPFTNKNGFIVVVISLINRDKKSNYDLLDY